MAAVLVTPVNGRAGRFQINGVNWNIDKFTGTVSTTLGDITGFEGQQADGRTPTNRTDGNDDCQLQIEGPVDTTLIPATGGMTQGAVLTNVKGFLDKVFGGRYVGCTRMQVESVQFNVVEKEPATRYSATVRCAGGTITNPT